MNSDTDSYWHLPTALHGTANAQLQHSHTTKSFLPHSSDVFLKYTVKEEFECVVTL